MSRFASVRARLVLALLLVVAVALGAAYAIVVPSLERRLVDAKLDQVERDADTAFAQIASQPEYPVQIRVETAAALVNVRVVVFDVYDAQGDRPPTLVVLADSNPVESKGLENDAVASRTAVTGVRQRGTVERGDERYGEAAIPLAGGRQVLLVAAPLRDSLANVRLVERRLLAAGAIALLLALALGYAGASMFASRIRRLERAVERIAGGQFDQPVVDTGADELGQLAAAFDRMRERLARLDRERAEFIANASHELRTPLFSLGGFLELLADEDLDEQTRREFLATMREQVSRLTRLATDLLDLSRLDAGRLHVEREPLDLAAVAGSLVDEFRAVAERSEHPLEGRIEGAVSALGDEQRVLQIGRILVENALVHTPPGTRVAVRASLSDGRARLEVEDEGPGVPSDELEHVFHRFYRGNGGVASGSGLGLAIARELAELMGGRIALDSRPGRTAFALELPLASHARDPSAAAPEPVGHAFSREKIS